MYEQEHDDYFDWLLEQISNEELDHDKLMMLRQLYLWPFYYNVTNDAHRYEEAIDLRDQYTYETGCLCDVQGPCNVLEMLVSLAKMVSEDVLGNVYHENRTYEWFWMMIENLGLTSANVGERREIVRKWVERDFEFDGRGSPFPLRNPPEDQRSVEIWKQICNYIFENQWLEE